MEMMVLTFVGVPAVVFFSLCAVAPGKPALIGLFVAATATAALWFTAEPGFDGAFVGLLAQVVGASVGLAGFVQTVRLAFPATAPRIAYPAFVGLMSLAGLVGLASYLGV